MVKTLLETTVVADLQARVRRLEPDDSALWGVMSAEEMVCHVEQAFGIVLGELRPAPVANGGMRRRLMKVIALRVPFRWPKGVKTIPELEREMLQVAPGPFELHRTALVESVTRLAGAGALERDHPMFGRMSRWDWMRWGYLHTDHHLRQFGR